MALGNTECPNCGAHFEFDSEKSMVICPSCKATFMVRDIKMSTIVNNNYYNVKKEDDDDDDDEKQHTQHAYKEACEKMFAYALQNDGKAMNSMLNHISNEYPASYFFEVIRIAKKYSCYYAFFQVDKYFETKRQIIQNANPISNSVDDILERSVQQNGIWFNETKYLEQFVERINIENEKKIVTNLEKAIIYFQSFVNFAKELEESSYAQKYMKYDFEKEHYQAIMENAKDARLMLEKWKEKNRQLTSFVLNNRMKCKSFVTRLENEQKNCVYQSEVYTGDIIEGEPTGIVCGVLGSLGMIVTLIIMMIFLTSENGEDVGLIFGLIEIVSLILMLVGLLRACDDDKKKYIIICLFMPPILLFFSLYYTIRAIVKIVKSKKALKVLNSTISYIEMSARKYKNSAIYTDLKALELASGVRYEDLK